MGAAVDVLKVSDSAQISLVIRVLCVFADRDRPPMGAAVDGLKGSDSAQISLVLRVLCVFADRDKPQTPQPAS